MPQGSYWIENPYAQADVPDAAFAHLQEDIRRVRLNLGEWSLERLEDFEEQQEQAQEVEEEQEEDTPTVPQFRTGDLVTLVNEPMPTVRIGQWAVVDHVDREYGCSDPNCSSCATVGVELLTVADPAARNTWNEQYMRTNTRGIAHAPLEAGCRVRCLHVGHRGGGGWVHRYQPDQCVGPVRVREGGSLLSDLREGTQPLFTVELEAREQARREAAQRVRAMQPGQRYHITGSSSYYGRIAYLLDMPDADGRVICNVEDSGGYLVRSSIRLEAATFGGRIHDWQRGNAVPNFIQFMTPNYMGTAAPVADRDIADSADDHDCDHACFNYGCSASLGLTFVEDHDDDQEEPEYFSGDIPIMPYSYQPRLIFSGDGPVYLGTELELSTGSGRDAEYNLKVAAKIITESSIRDKVFLKGDSSISGYGFEAVFHPMSYAWLVENWPDDLLTRMREAGARPHSSCGMHVHVSRAGFSGPLHAYRWLKFMYRNAREMSRMARRDPSQWGSFSTPTERKAAKWFAKGGYGGENRYAAVNCMPSHTFEVRIFASTLNRNRFLGSLGLVDSSVEYTRQLSTQDVLKRDGWTFAPFREYVNSFKMYKPLAKEMVRLLDN